MSTLTDAGVVDITWDEDDDGTITAEGLQSYEIENTETGWELAVFQDGKCKKVIDAVDLCHAVSMVYSSEAVCRWYIHEGKGYRGRKVNEKGWMV